MLKTTSAASRMAARLRRDAGRGLIGARSPLPKSGAARAAGGPPDNLDPLLMPKPPLPEDLQAILRKPNPCVIATLGPDGAPRTAATWYDWLDDGTVLLNMDDSRRRLPHMRREPRVALTILDGESWYRHPWWRCRIRPDPELEDIDRLSRRYTDRPYRDRQRRSWTAIVEVERWHAWEGGHLYQVR